ncbi:unannotated protein [freshwater metagenome]|uniref:Unannotated protein n=1 Tax=freshwater metagenome TaxID=449393 RepID=A0A6J7IYU3_9ZZZZ
MNPLDPDEEWPFVKQFRESTMNTDALLARAVCGLDFVVDRWIPAESLVLVYGPSGAGKSSVTIDMALSMLHAMPWGGNPIDNAGSVVYWAGEGVQGIGQRVRAWYDYHKPDDPSSGCDVHWATASLDLSKPEWGAAVAKFSEGLAPSAVFVDTFARATAGIEENSSRDVGLVIYELDRIRKAIKAPVIVVHHSGKDASKGARGSSAMRAAVDVEIEVTGSENRVMVRCTKMRDAEPPEPIEFERVSVGESFVLVPAVRSATMTRGTQSALDALRAIDIPDGVANNVWKNACVEAGIAESSFFRYRSTLVKHGLACNVGTDKQPRYAVYREEGAA